jgi:DNA-binding IclR family transcriptional regulator
MTVKSEGGSRDIQSLHRAFDILEIIGAGGDLGVTEIARRASLPVSTVHNLLRTMAKRHYVVGSGGRYNLGPAVTVLTSQWDPVRSLSRVIKHHLESVIEATGQTGFGTMLVGDRARVIAYHPGPGPITVNEHHDDGADPLGIATGRLLVAMSRESEWDHFIRAAGDLEPGWTTRHWRDDLRAIAASGVCVRHLPSVESSTAVVIAVPVWGPGGQVICSIASGAPTFQITAELVERIIDALWETSLALSADLGCDSVPMVRPDPRLPVLRALSPT